MTSQNDACGIESILIFQVCFGEIFSVRNSNRHNF